MLVEAERLGCLREVLPIVAGIAIPDVRERPAEHAAAADALHRRFWAPLDGESAADPGRVRHRRPAATVALPA